MTGKEKTMKKRTVLVFIGIYAVLLCPWANENALAYFGVNAPDAQRTPGGILKKAGLFQEHINLRGERIAAETLKGFGRGEQLQDALRSILGREWKVSYGGVDPRGHVSWKSRGTRGETLDYIGKLYGFVIDIDWASRKVSVYRPGYAGTMKEFTPGTREIAFRTLPELSLKGNIIRWGKRAGWTVVWRSHWNYPVRMSESFGPSFEGAVSKIVKSANKTGGSHYIVDFYPNRVVVVRDN